MRRPWLAAGVALVVWLGAAAPRAAELVDETVRASPDGEVSIDNLAGSVTVTGWDRNEIQVRGTRASDAELVIEPDDDEIEIEVKLPRLGRSTEETDLEILVPARSKLKVSTASARVSVDKVLGKVKIETVSGDVLVKGEPRRVKVETVSGETEISGVRGSVEVESVSGRILVEGGEKVEASTTSGRIEITGDLYRSVQATSVSGPILFDGDPNGDGEFEFDSFSGTVELDLPSSVAGEFDIETFSGKIRSDFEGQMRSPQHGPGATMSGSIGRGNARFAISTFSGSIHLRAR